MDEVTYTCSEVSNPMPSALYETFLEKEELISPEEYLNLTKEQKAEIKDIQIVPPRIGSRSLGLFRITRRSPVYEIEGIRKSS